MFADMFSFAFLAIAFGSGVLTVLAPCILPLLPVIVGGTISGERSVRRAVTVVASLGASVLVFTLALKATTVFIAVPPVFWNLLSGGLLIAFGLVTAFPSLWENLGFTALLNRKANAAMSKGFAEKSFWGDILVGVALGPVFTSCSPTYFILLATVLPAHPAIGLVYLFAYTLGLSIALLLIALVGQKIVDRLGVASDPRAWFKRTIGAIFIIVGVAVIFGIDRKIAASLPSAVYGVSQVEQRILEFVVGMDDTEKKMPTPEEHMLGAEAATSVETTTQSIDVVSAIAQKSRKFDHAPELVAPDGYVNTDGQPITLGAYRGKVVLVDFWTYSCINCQRTTPYLNAWYEKYKDQGFVIVGVHTPEFAFEQVKVNVESAAKAAGIEYPGARTTTIIGPISISWILTASWFMTTSGRAITTKRRRRFRRRLPSARPGLAWRAWRLRRSGFHPQISQG
jgi:cytochrome c biogenesis protein CcdA/thiol-disulfide isomerase/thioredoxin